MNDNQEIEVEVVEVVDQEPAARSSRPTADSGRPLTSSQPSSTGSTQRPFGGFSGRSSMRSLRIPGYLWPLAIIVGLIVFLIALVLVILIVIPLLILRAIFRLFR